jgi:hypothetical protein
MLGITGKWGRRHVERGSLRKNFRRDLRSKCQSEELFWLSCPRTLGSNHSSDLVSTAEPALEKTHIPIFPPQITGQKVQNQPYTRTRFWCTILFQVGLNCVQKTTQTIFSISEFGNTGLHKVPCIFQVWAPVYARRSANMWTKVHEGLFKLPPADVFPFRNKV